MRQNIFGSDKLYQSSTTQSAAHTHAPRQKAPCAYEHTLSKSACKQAHSHTPHLPVAVSQSSVVTNGTSAKSFPTKNEAMGA